MQFKLSALIAVAIATLAVATPARRNDSPPAGTECCSTVTNAGSAAASAILKSIGVVVDDVNALVGLNCSPVTVIGTGTCAGGTTVTCQDNSHAPLISISCVPVTL